MKKTVRLLIVFALVAAVVVIAQSQIAWADFAADAPASPAKDSPAQAHLNTGLFAGTINRDCPIVIRLSELGVYEHCVGGSAMIIVDDTKEGVEELDALAAEFWASTCPEILEAIEGINFPDDLVFPEDCADLPDLPPFPLVMDDLLSPPILVIYDINKDYVADLTDDTPGFEDDISEICYARHPEKSGHVSFFSIFGDTVEWGDEEVLDTYFSVDDNGNPMACAKAYRSGIYVYVEN